MTPIPRRLLVLLAAAFPVATAQAGIDDLQLQRSLSAPFQLRWDNVTATSDDYWLAGVRPQRDSRQDLYHVLLGPGEDTLLRLPAGEQLRIHGDAPLPMHALEIFRGNGSGLELAQHPLATTTPETLLISGDRNDPSLIRIRRAADSMAPIRVSLFVSRRLPPDPIVRYRDLRPLPAPRVMVQNGFLTAAEPYWQLAAGAPITLPVSGQPRLLLEVRAIFPPNADAREQVVDLTLDGAADSPQRLIDTVAEQARPVWVDGRPAVVSRREHVYFDLVPGAVSPQLRSSVPVLVRVLALTPDDYLLPSLNRPTATDETQTKALQLAEQKARAAWRAGAVRESGLTAVARLEQAAGPRVAFPEVVKSLHQFRQQASLFRDLLPSARSAGGAAHLAYYTPPRVRDVGEAPLPLSGAAQHHVALQATLAHGRFLPIGGQPAADAVPPGLQNRAIALSGDVLFDTDRDTLRDEAFAAIKALIKELGTAEGTIAVIGHTDSRASDAYNQDLSERRAERVVRTLVDAGFAPGRLRAVGRGEREPRASNDTSDGRQSNRRVEIRFQSRPAAPVAPAMAPRYELPERFAPSVLRLAVHAPEAVAGTAAPAEPLFLQFDDAPPQRLEIRPPPSLPAGVFADTPGALALRIEGALWPALGGNTHSGPFALTAPPAPHITAGVIELPLPASVRSVRLWRAQPAGQPLYAALQYRASKPWAAPEAAQAAGAADGATPAANFPPALARLLDAAQRGYAATLQPPSSGPGLPLAAPDDGGARVAARAATSADPLGSLEDTADDPTLTAAERAWLQNELLLRLGEEHLALQRWRQLAWYATTPQARQQARNRLDHHYRHQQDVNARIQLHAAALGRGDIDAAVLLSEALLDADDADLARSVLMMLPPADRPIELLLAAAYGSRWWQLFDATLPRHPDPARRAYWQAYRAQTRGDDPLPLFEAADAEGLALAAHMREAERLRAADPPPTTTAQTAWNQWAAGHPGPHTWRDASFLAADQQGAVTLYHLDRDRYGTALTASATRPLRLRFAGPRKLRIEARPLHPATGDVPLEGWLRIRSAEGLWLEPITNNRPAEAVEVRVTPPARAGRAIQKELAFGPGWHELAIDGESLPLLLQVSQSSSLRPLALLPIPGDWHGTPAPAARPIDGFRHFGWCGDCSAVVSPDQGRLDLWRVPATGAWQGHDRLTEDVTTTAATRPASDTPALARLLARDDRHAVLNLPPADTQSIRERAIALLWLSEKAPELRAAALAQGLAAAHAFPGISDIAAIADRLARGSGWVPLPAVQRSAGRQLIPADPRQPESPALRIRQALLPPLAPDERRLSGEGHLLIAFDNPLASPIVLRLAGEELALPPGAPLQVRVQVGEQSPTTFGVTAGGEALRVPLVIPRGRHTLRIGLVEPVANQFLRIGIEEAGAPPMTSERSYHVATPGAPVEAGIAGPAWLRIDEWREGRTISNYRYLAEPWQTVRLPAADGRPTSLYRLFLRRLEPNRPVTPPRMVSVPPQPVPAPESIPDTPSAAGPAHLVDVLPLGGQEAGTWTLAAGWTNRPQLDDQPRPAIYRDEFLELSARYRHHAADPRDYRSMELLGRLRRDGGPTLGLRAEWSGPLGASPIGFSLDGAAYLQRPETADAPTPLPPPLATLESAALPGNSGGRTEGAVAFSASLHQQRPLGPRTWHVPQATAFAGWQSLDANRRVSADAANQFFDSYLAGTGYISRSDYLRRHARYEERSLDHDVFSPYRADHGFGVRLSDTLTHQPWLDTLWYARASLTSNADLQLWKPDHAQLQAGWRQLLGPMRLHAEYQVTRYAADRHRTEGATLDAIKVAVLAEGWRTRHQRTELGLTVGYDLSRETGTVHLVWRMDFGNGRGFRDYRPADVDFRDLREQRLPTTDNNRIEAHETR